ncbi:hypothetical protein [Nesterenkonia alba]|uniref:hypothetical protein n=1 Tax=Nesterenkonia alba TaxID=515814 RepID=UPI0003FABBDF|nr:hypothetical protein [Nesterenkonia alba]
MSASPPPGQPNQPVLPPVVPPPGKNSADPRRGNPRQKDPQQQAADARYASRFLGWLVLAIILAWGGFQLPLPWKIITPVAALAGIATAVVLFIQCVRRRLPVFIYIATVLATVCCGFFLLIGGFQLVFWEATAEFDACRETAVTDRALRQCAVDYEQRVISSIPGSG